MACGKNQGLLEKDSLDLSEGFIIFRLLALVENAFYEAFSIDL
ncbi:hypothetical protein [Desulfosporosinus sp. SB140]